MNRIEEYEERRRHQAARAKKSKRQSITTNDEYARARNVKVLGQKCRVCGSLYRVEAHHIVPRAKFTKRATTVHAEDNLMPLCHDHHQSHHTSGRHPVKWHMLTIDEIDFAIEKMGDQWVVKWYPLAD